ncbi:MAG: hypothetical protein L3J35_08530 [Bacteroidales bacterium]|nr:hypothetical protein [Bacteroidales bacterium]
MNRNLLITVAFLVLFSGKLFSQNQNVSINTTGMLPDASAMLDVAATDKGILIPRMNSAQRQAIVAPATGLLVYDTSLDGFWFFDGIQWAQVGGTSSVDGLISAFSWTDATNLLRVTEEGTNWDVTINNEADDLSDNFINDLSNVNASPTGAGQILEWNGTQWVAGIDDSGSGGATINNFVWTDATDLLTITEGTTDWSVNIDNEADDLSDNIINDLSNVNANPVSGQVLKWNGSQWTADADNIGGGATITNFLWSDGSDLLRITEGGIDWDVNIDNEADDLSNNIINDLSNVNAIPSVSGQVLKWDGSSWYAGTDDAGSGATISNFTWTDATDLLRITENGINWDVTIDNEADDLSNNIINDLSNVNATPALNDFLQWNGSAWVAGTASGASCVTLQEAYNCGGNGFGRQVNIDYGAIELYLTSTLNGTDAFYAESSTGTAANPTSAVTFQNAGTGAAIYAYNTSTANAYNTIFAETNSSNDYTSGVAGYYTGTAFGVGVYGRIDDGANGTAGVMGVNTRTDGGHGVLGQGVNGIVGQTNYQAGYGVYGSNADAIGDNTQNAVGTYGIGYVGVWGDFINGGLAMYSNGNMEVNGDFTVWGTKAFTIDHPLDPENKKLRHFCAESPEILNIYRGNIVLDENGEAVVELPKYFDAININYSYYLTPIGKAADLYIKEEVKNNEFKIAGGTNNLKVSWVLYAERNDKYIQQNQDSKIVEVEKNSRERGKYLMPQLYNQPESKSIRIAPPAPVKQNADYSQKGRLEKKR